MRLPRPVRRRHSIVLTSLVDVMFVLLFFFMLAASAVERRAIGIGMPVSDDAGPVASSRLELDLLGPTQWTLGGTPLRPSQLRPMLIEAVAGEVLIRTAPGVPVQALTDALTAVRESGRTLRLVRLGVP